MNTISLAEFADRLNEILPVIFREYARQHAKVFSRIKLTHQQFVILHYLNREGGTKMSDLARMMSVTTAAMTGLVTRLVRDGYVVRENDPKDRRVIMIAMTQKGSRVAQHMDEQGRKTIMDIYGRITQKEREEYLRILSHLKECLK